jgi:tRNA(His) guanylyltransferase
MKFDELDQKMRVFETAHDHCVLPGIFVVARLDGRNFTRLTKEVHNFKTPFDETFRDYMIETVKHLMNCGFKIIYGYTESDEISLLFHPEESSFSRKLRKLNSVLSGEASAKFSLLLGDHAVFDSRISQLTNINQIVDYFRWRNEDAFRNALNAHCYWKLRDDGYTPKKATKYLEGVSVADKNELLFKYGTNFNDLPDWEKRGIGLYWETYKKEGYNPKDNKKVVTERMKIKVDLNLPMKDDYSGFIKKLVAQYQGD